MSRTDTFDWKFTYSEFSLSIPFDKIPLRELKTGELLSWRIASCMFFTCIFPVFFQKNTGGANEHYFFTTLSLLSKIWLSKFLSKFSPGEYTQLNYLPNIFSYFLRQIWAFTHKEFFEKIVRSSSLNQACKPVCYFLLYKTCRSKKEKRNTTIEVQFWSFRPNLPKKGFLPKTFLVEYGQSENHHWILLNRIILCTKFELELTILIFWIKFDQKGYFRSKIEKMNTTLELSIFELIWVTNFSLN